MEFSLQDASRVFPEASVSDLRNWIKRGLLKYVGPVPAPGAERRFTRAGMYELGLILALSEGGLMPMPRAADIVQRHFNSCELVGAMALASQMDLPFERALAVVQSDAERVLTMELDPKKRDLRNPFFWVFVFDSKNQAHTLQVAHGWEEVGPMAQQTVEYSYPRMASFMDRAAAAPAIPPVPEKFILTGRPYVHIFNVTAVLYCIDQAIIENLPAQTE